MEQYRKQFSAQTDTLVNLLIENGVLDKRVGDLAKDPVNVTGIRILATQIEAAGAKYESKNKN
jgi:hypothetical protein